MLTGNGTQIEMCEGDYGVSVPVTVSGVTLGASDSLKFTFKTNLNRDVILQKEYSSISQNKINLSFTEAESALFTPGSYVYSLDWYQNGSFMCNLVKVGSFVVGDKA